MMNKLQFVFLNALIVSVTALIIGGVLSYALIKLTMGTPIICQQFYRCFAEVSGREDTTDISTAIGGTFILILMTCGYIISYIAYWVLSSRAFMRSLGTKKSLMLKVTFFLALAMLPSLYLSLGHYFMLSMAQIAFICSGILVCQIQWPLLVFLKRILLSERSIGVINA